jgi:hypothetical protein
VNNNLMAILGGVMGLVVLFCILVAIGPLLLIWASNVLFGMGIGYSLKTWAAMFVLTFFMGGYIRGK